MDLVHIGLAILGLSFLVFIHEFGHYWVARREGMRVEVFSIGFGRPMYSWTRDGVKWQICYLLFGGYVKIAGMDREDGAPDGFYAKSPWARIKVVLMGPIVNIVFALLAFTALWVMGGREKRFEEFTHVIGWVDPKSELFEGKKIGVRPGDVITRYGGKGFSGFKDFLTGGVKNGHSIAIAGERVDYVTGERLPYQYEVEAYQMAGYPEGMKTIGVAPANSIIFYGFDGKQSPAYGSGIERGDRVIWANGEVIFSSLELRNVVNRQDAYLTVERDGKIIHVRSPRVALQDLQLTKGQRDEFLDWRHAMGATAVSNDPYFIPYEVDVLGVVRGTLPYIDADLVEEGYKVSGLDEPLQVGDCIVAVNGKSVTNGLEIFHELQLPKVLMIVQRGQDTAPVDFDQADTVFAQVDWKGLSQLVGEIGTGVSKVNNLVLLQPIEPVQLDHNGPYYVFVDARVGDQRVIYNPNPVVLFQDVIGETWFTLKSLVTGHMNPKWLSGPVGIVKAMQHSMGIGYKEALYWMGLVSLSLGIMNLLPIPGLDGGHVCFSLWEGITRRSISSKVMSKLVLPFLLALVTFFIYVTVHDITRFF